MCLALELKRFIKFCEDAGLGFVEREHHFQMCLQQFATILSTAGSFRRSSRRGEKEDIVVLQTEPWLFVDIEELADAMLLCMSQPQSLVRESYETGSHFMSYFDNFVGQ